MARATFLPGASKTDFKFSGNTSEGDYNQATSCEDKSKLYTTSNCKYPRAVVAASRCPFLAGYYTECKCLSQFNKTSCTAPYILGGTSCDGKYEKCVCPANATCSSCSKQTTTCGGGATMYKMTGCQSGYTQEGNSCVTGYIKGLTSCSNQSCCSGCESLETCPEDSSYKRCRENTAKIVSFVSNMKYKIKNFHPSSQTPCSTLISTCVNNIAGGSSCYSYYRKHMSADGDAGFECEGQVYGSGCR